MAPRSRDDTGLVGDRAHQIGGTHAGLPAGADKQPHDAWPAPLPRSGDGPGRLLARLAAPPARRNLASPSRPQRRVRQFTAAAAMSMTSNSSASDSTTTRTSSSSPCRSRSRSDARQLQPPRAKSATVGMPHLDLLSRDVLDGAQQAVLARLDQRDGRALAPGPAGAADAVDVGVGRRRQVVVEDVRELLDVESARRDVGGDQQVRRRRSKALHHRIALPLLHAAVQRLGPIAVRVERLDERVDLEARAAEHEGRRGSLDVEHALSASALCARATT